MRDARWSLAIWFTTVVIVLVATAMLIATWTADVPDSWAFRGSAAVLAMVSGTVGAVVARRRPENIIGWLFSAVGVLLAVQAFLVEYVIASTLVVDGGLPLTTPLAWILVWIWVPAVGISLVFLPLLFPTGLLLSPRWRVVVVVGVVALVIFGVANAFIPGPVDQARVLDNPLGAAGSDPQTYNDRVLGPASIPLAFAIVLAASSLIIRFLRSDAEHRQQIKWFAFASVIAGATFAAYGMAIFVVAPEGVVKVLEIAVIAGLTSLPTMAGLAILRYRLYEIDRIISRTIGWAIVTGLLVGTFAVLVVGLQTVIEPLFDGNTLAIAGSTLVVAALFAPLRSRVQRAVDRRFDRSRYDGERLLAGFGEWLRDEVDLSTISREARQTVDAAVRPASVGLWLRGRSGGGA